MLKRDVHELHREVVLGEGSSDDHAALPRVDRDADRSIGAAFSRRRGRGARDAPTLPLLALLAVVERDRHADDRQRDLAGDRVVAAEQAERPQAHERHEHDRHDGCVERIAWSGSPTLRPSSMARAMFSRAGSCATRRPRRARRPRRS